MQLINTLLYYLNLIGVITLLTLVLTGAVLFYFIKIKKVSAKVENINTSVFKKQDAISYCAFEDIASVDGSLDSDGVIAINERVFVAGLSVRGFDFYSASNAERVNTIVNAVSFFNVVEKPTSFRQSVRAVDLSENIEDYQETVVKLGEELMDLDEEYQTVLEASREYVDEPESYKYYDKYLKELQNAILSKKHMADECRAVISYMEAQGKDVKNGGNGVDEKANQILFSYIFNPDDYTEELNKEEIFLKAVGELNIRGRVYIDALADCNFRGRRLSGREIVDLMRKHASPITSSSVRLDDLLDSSYTSLFVSSDSLVEACKGKIGEDIYLAEREAYEKSMSNYIEEQKEKRREEAYALFSDAYEQASLESREEK